MCELNVDTSRVEMKKSTRKHSNSIIIMCTVTCIVLYSLTGYYGYASFGKSLSLTTVAAELTVGVGEATDGDILKDYPPDDVLMLVTKLIMAVHIVLAYPVVLYPGKTSQA